MPSGTSGSSVIAGREIDRESPAKSAKQHKLWHLGSPIMWATLDGIMAATAMAAGFVLSPSLRSLSDVPNHLSPTSAATVFGCAAFVLSCALGLSHYPNLKSRFRIISLVSLFVLTTFIVTLIVVNFILYKQIGRYILLIAPTILWTGGLLARLFWYAKVRNGVHHIAVLGDNYVLGPFNEMLAHSTFPIRVVARHVSSSDEIANRRFCELLEGSTVHEVLVHGARTLHSDLLFAAMDRGVTVSTFDTFSERHFFRIPSEFLSHSWFFQIDFRQYHPFYSSSKRVSDVLLALIGGLLTLPILMLAIILIKLTSRGPAFYSQTRVGFGQERFTIWKLRSMHADSENAGPQWAQLKDPRVTFIGRILRKTRIDELPQFWNILLGDMSFIGPRPERPEFVEELAKNIPYYRQRHLIKPGLTGWAQICYRYGASEQDARDKLSYDLYYLKNASWALDVQIMLQTLGAIAKGAR